MIFAVYISVTALVVLYVLAIVIGWYAAELHYHWLARRHDR